MAQTTQEQQLSRDIARVRDEIDRARWELSETLDELTYRASPREIVRRRRERMRASMRNVRESVMGPAQRMTDTMASGAHGVADQAREAPELIERRTQGNPLAAGLIAFGAGLLVATLIPPTEPEKQAAAALQEKLEPAKEKAMQAGQGIKADVQDAARSGLEEVKDSAKGAAANVTEEARSSGSELMEEAQQRTQHVRDTSR